MLSVLRMVRVKAGEGKKEQTSQEEQTAERKNGEKGGRNKGGKEGYQSRGDGGSSTNRRRRHLNSHVEVIP